MEVFEPIEVKAIPPSALESYRIEGLIGSKEEKFHRNLKREEVKVFICLGFGEIILNRKRIFGKKCWMIKITSE